MLKKVKKGAHHNVRSCLEGVVVLELTLRLMGRLISPWSTSLLQTLWGLSLPLMPSTSSTRAGWRGGRLGVAFGGGSRRRDWAGLCRGLWVALGGGCCCSWRLGVTLGGGRGGWLRVALGGGRCCTRWWRSWLRVTLGRWTRGRLGITFRRRRCCAWGWGRRLRVAFRRWTGGRLRITFR